MITKEGSTKYNLMTQGQGFCIKVRPHKSYNENAIFLFLYFGAWIRQIKHIVMMNKKRSTKIVSLREH